MYKQVLSGIPGIELYPIVALLVFFVFFVGLVVWSFRTSSAHLEHLARIPLDPMVEPDATTRNSHS